MEIVAQHPDTGDRCVLEVSEAETLDTLTSKACTALFSLLGFDDDEAELRWEDGTALGTSDITCLGAGDVIQIHRVVSLRAKAQCEQYLNLADSLCGSHATVSVNGEPKTRMELLTLAVQQNVYSSRAFCELGYALPHNETILLDAADTPFAKTDLYLRALQLDNTNAGAYANLGVLLGANETATIGGKEMNKRELYLAAIHCAPETCSAAYYNLAITLDDAECLEIEGESWDKSKILVKVIEIEPRHYRAYNSLAHVVARGETITMSDNSVKTKETLHIRALALKRNNFSAYYNLGLLAERDGFTLENGKVLSKLELLLKAQSINTGDCRVLNTLACVAPQGGSIELLDRTKVTRRDLLKRSLALNPRYSKALYHLAVDLGYTEVVSIGGEAMNKRQLFMRCIASDARCHKAYCGLATTLAPNDSLRLPSGKVVNKKELLMHALSLNFDYAVARVKLAEIMAKGERLSFPAGKRQVIVSKRDLLNCGTEAKGSTAHTEKRGYKQKWAAFLGKVQVKRKN